MKCITCGHDFTCSNNGLYCGLCDPGQYTTKDSSKIVKYKSLQADDGSELAKERQAYDNGYVNGLWAYAHWKDGVQYVGTGGKTLLQAVSERKQGWNYKQPSGK